MRANKNSLSSVFEAVLSETLFGLFPILEGSIEPFRGSRRLSGYRFQTPSVGVPLKAPLEPPLGRPLEISHKAPLMGPSGRPLDHLPKKGRNPLRTSLVVHHPTLARSKVRGPTNKPTHNPEKCQRNAALARQVHARTSA